MAIVSSKSAILGSSNLPIAVAIIGAGIGGITMAIALSKHNPNLDASIFESRPTFSEIGAGIGKCLLLISQPSTCCAYSIPGFGPNAYQAMTLISPDWGVKSASSFPEKDNVWCGVRHDDGPKAGQLIAEMAASKGFYHCRLLEPNSSMN